jgi:small subunit ribosomal protein S6
MIIHEYETTLIYHPEVPESETQRITERLDGVIANFEGTKLFHDLWGNRKLAYPIRKQARGVYHHMGFVATADCIAELERVMRIESHIMRFLTVRLSEDVDLEERQLAASNRVAVMTPGDGSDEDDSRERRRDGPSGHRHDSDSDDKPDNDEE